MFKVERTKLEDLEQIAKIYDQAFDTTTDFAKMKKNFKKLNKDNDYIFISAYENQRCIGFAHLVITQDIFERTNPFATFWSFCVEESYRNKGVGTAILAYAETEARKRCCEFMKLTTRDERKACVAICEKRKYRKSICYTIDF